MLTPVLVSGVVLTASGLPVPYGEAQARLVDGEGVDTLEATSAGLSALVAATADQNGHVSLAIFVAGRDSLWSLLVRGGDAEDGETFLAPLFDTDGPALDLDVLRRRSEQAEVQTAKAESDRADLVDEVASVVLGSLPDPGGDGPAPYVHHQDVPAALWTVSHGLGALGLPVVLLDTLGRQFLAAVSYPDPDTILVSLGVPIGGTAHVSPS